VARNINQVSFRRGGGKKRLTEWGIGSFPTGVSALAASTKAIAVLVPAANLEPESPATIVRTRLELMIESDQSVAPEAQLGAFAIGFVNVVAGALGITALPGPVTDLAWGGWFVYQPIMQSVRATTNIGFSRWNRTYHIDSKAMRKFESDMSMVWMIENSSATAGFNFAVGGRILVKAG